MSIQAMTWVLEHSEERLGRRLVLLALADNAHDDGTNAWPSQETIARKARLTDRQVRNCLKAMEGTSIEKAGTHESGTTIWRILMGAENISGAEIYDSDPRKNRAGEVSDFSDKPSLPKPSREPLSISPSEAFKTFYSDYPRKEKPRRAEKAWGAAVKRATVDEIMAGLAAAKRFWDAEHTPVKYIPHPSTWLNDDAWASDYDTAPSSPVALDPKIQSIKLARELLTDFDSFEAQDKGAYPFDAESCALMGEPPPRTVSAGETGEEANDNQNAEPPTG